MSDYYDYYDRKGRPISLDEWCKAWTEDHKRVARTERGDVTVSTVWLGLDHSFGRATPLIFETMVFGGPLDEHCERYSTEAQARAGHAEICSAAFRSSVPS